MTSKAKRFRRHLAEERDAAAVYRAMADRSEGERRAILLELAEAEDRHAQHWVGKLEELGERPPAVPRRLGWRAAVLVRIARAIGVNAVVPLLERGEAGEISRYDAEPAALPHMVTDERLHARTIASLFPAWRTRTSGSLRAATFGVNDGLVSNLALVMGVAGGQASDQTILLAGLVGLLGGGLSMGIGEWISVTSQRELWEGEIELTTEHLEALPESSTNELALLYRAKGMAVDEAEQEALRSLRDPAVAAQLLASEKLGFDTRALGSPWTAAGSNFGAFVIGASVPVAAYVISSGTAAFVAAVLASAVALFAVGALISVITYRSVWLAGLRQLAIGALAAAVSFGLGTIVGGALG